VRWPERFTSGRQRKLLQSSQEYFRAPIQNSWDIITVVDAEGIILYQSPAMKRTLGYEPEERIGKNAVEAHLLHPEDFTVKIEAFANALRNLNTPGTVEVHMRHRNGSWRCMEETIANCNEVEPVGLLFGSAQVFTGTLSSAWAY
jgi:PAS domain S-box-containing protein